MTALDTLADVLHAAGVAGFTYDPAVDPPHATVKGGEMGGATTWWASCKPCWWWDEDEPDYRSAFDPGTAQARADAHNRIHHQEVNHHMKSLPNGNEIRTMEREAEAIVAAPEPDREAASALLIHVADMLDTNDEYGRRLRAINQQLDTAVDDPEVVTPWCAWCEDAESPTYLAHEGHDKECPLQ